MLIKFEKLPGSSESLDPANAASLAAAFVN